MKALVLRLPGFCETRWPVRNIRNTQSSVANTDTFADDMYHAVTLPAVHRG